jgi:hypothetical protein
VLGHALRNEWVGNLHQHGARPSAEQEGRLAVQAPALAVRTEQADRIHPDRLLARIGDVGGARG